MKKRVNREEIARAYSEEYLNGNKTVKQIGKDFGCSGVMISTYGQMAINKATELHRHMTGKNAVAEDIKRSMMVTKEEGKPPLTPEQFYNLKMVKGWQYPSMGAYDIWMENKNKNG